MLVGDDRHVHGARRVDDVMCAGARRRRDDVLYCGKRCEPMNVRHAEERNRSVRDGETRERRRCSDCAGLTEDECNWENVERHEHEDAECRPPILHVLVAQRDESVWIRCCY